MRFHGDFAEKTFASTRILTHYLPTCVFLPGLYYSFRICTSALVHFALIVSQ